MPVSVLDLITSLENDLAGFYRKMLTLNRFAKSRALFQAMVDESLKHALQGGELLKRQPVPATLDLRATLVFQARVKDSLFAQLTAEKSLTTVFQTLADGEALIGDLYRKIAALLSAGPPAQPPVAKVFQTLAAEEDEHRARLIAELRNYLENASLDELVKDNN